MSYLLEPNDEDLAAFVTELFPRKSDFRKPCFDALCFATGPGVRRDETPIRVADEVDVMAYMSGFCVKRGFCACGARLDVR